MLEIPNSKSQTNHNDQNSKVQNRLGHLVIALWNFALGEPAEGRIPQGGNLRFVCNLVLGVWDFIVSISPECSRIKAKPALGETQCRVRRAWTL